MMKRKFGKRLVWAVLATVSIAWAGVLAAQGPGTPVGLTDNDSGEPKLKVTARFHLEEGTHRGFLIIRAQIPKDNYIYGVHQKKGSPSSKFVLAKTDQIRITAKFKPDKAPKVIANDPIFNARIEKHFGEVQFYAPIVIQPSANPAAIHPKIRFNGQMCSDAGFCVPIRDRIIPVEFAGYFRRDANRKPTEQTRGR